MKKLVFVVVLAAGVAAGFAVGRKCALCACGANAPGAAVAPSDNALDEAKKRIAALESELAKTKKDAERALMEIELQMQPLAKRERKALLGALTKELGYSGDDGAVVTDTIEGIFDCTGSGGLGGLADIGGLVEGMDIQPGVSIETHVIGL